MKLREAIVNLVSSSSIRTFGLMAGGLVNSGMLGWVIWILWQGGWTAQTEAQRIWFLGWTGFALVFNTMIVIVSLAAARVNVKGLGGTSAEISAGDSAAPIVTTTTQTKVEAPQS